MAGFFKKVFSFGKKEVVEKRAEDEALAPINWDALKEFRREEPAPPSSLGGEPSDEAAHGVQPSSTDTVSVAGVDIQIDPPATEPVAELLPDQALLPPLDGEDGGEAAGRSDVFPADSTAYETPPRPELHSETAPIRGEKSAEFDVVAPEETPSTAATAPSAPPAAEHVPLEGGGDDAPVATTTHVVLPEGAPAPELDAPTPPLLSREASVGAADQGGVDQSSSADPASVAGANIEFDPLATDPVPDPLPDQAPHASLDRGGSREADGRGNVSPIDPVAYEAPPLSDLRSDSSPVEAETGIELDVGAPEETPRTAGTAASAPPEAEPLPRNGGEGVAPLSAPELRSQPATPAAMRPAAGKVTVAKIVAQKAEPLPVVAAPEPRLSWFQRLREGLSRSSRELSANISGVFTKRKLDEETLQDLEDVLIRADLGLETAIRITDALSSGRYGKNVSDDEVRTVMAEEISKVLTPVALPLELDLSHKPHVILVVGVNGTGKTTTIGKLAAKLHDGGLSVMLAAGDTFRAAAIEQLKIWGERTNSPVVSSKIGADAAGLAYDAFAQAKAAGSDVLIIDTAGRLQNKVELMAELEKIVRVLGKLDPEAPHTVLQTVDATTGQNALNQVEIFRNVAGVNGLVMTKLDGTARGGILVGIAAKYKLPVYFIGVGEQVDDLEPFSASDFAKAIAGVA